MMKHKWLVWCLGAAAIVAAFSLVFAQVYGPGRFSIVHLYDGSNDTCTAYDSDRLFGDTDCDGTKDGGEEYLDNAQTTVPGNDTEIIYNDSGSFGSESAFTYDDATDIFTAPSIVVSDGETGITLEESQGNDVNIATFCPGESGDQCGFIKYLDSSGALTVYSGWDLSGDSLADDIEVQCGRFAGANLTPISIDCEGGSGQVTFNTPAVMSSTFNSLSGGVFEDGFEVNNDIEVNSGTTPDLGSSSFPFIESHVNDCYCYSGSAVGDGSTADPTITFDDTVDATLFHDTSEACINTDKAFCGTRTIECYAIFNDGSTCGVAYGYMEGDGVSVVPLNTTTEYGMVVMRDMSITGVSATCEISNYLNTEVLNISVFDGQANSIVFEASKTISGAGETYLYGTQARNVDVLQAGDWFYVTRYASSANKFDCDYCVICVELTYEE